MPQTRDETVTLRVTAADRRLLEAAAEEAGTTLSTFAATAAKRAALTRLRYPENTEDEETHDA